MVTPNLRQAVKSKSCKSRLLFAVAAISFLLVFRMFREIVLSWERPAVGQAALQPRASVVTKIQQEGAQNADKDVGSRSKIIADEGSGIGPSMLPQKPSQEGPKQKRLPDIITKHGKQITAASINQIALLGERNTGTTWIANQLEDCFEHKIPIRSSLVRHKHWMQHDVVPNRRVRDTLVVAEFRNPCYWVEAMQRKEYRTPMHYKLKDWRKFVTTPWTLPERMQYDVDLVEAHARENGGVANYSVIPCQENFTYNQINSCLAKPYLEGEEFVKRAERRKERHAKHGDERDEFSGQEPLYEMRDDGSGEPYGNILEMRSGKIRNFLGVAEWDWIAAVLPVQYDEMVRDGTSALIRNIEEITGIEAKCQPSPPQNRTPRELPEDFVEWMTENIDWETEALIGFDKC